MFLLMTPNFIFMIFFSLPSSFSIETHVSFLVPRYQKTSHFQNWIHPPQSNSFFFSLSFFHTVWLTAPPKAQESFELLLCLYSWCLWLSYTSFCHLFRLWYLSLECHYLYLDYFNSCFCIATRLNMAIQYSLPCRI